MQREPPPPPSEPTDREKKKPDAPSSDNDTSGSHDEPNQKPLTTLPAAWHLTPEAHARILQTQILPAELYPFLPPSPPQHQPLAVFVLGQTGAGKTRLAPRLHAALTRSLSGEQQQQQQQQQQQPVQPVHLIADTYKRYHPHYGACLARAPQQASALAGPAAAEWLRGVCERAAAAGASVLVEAACRRRGDVERLVRVFSSDDSSNDNSSSSSSSSSATGAYRYRYRVRVVVLAVPAALSRLGIAVRYHAGLPEAGSRGLPARLTPRRVHDESFAGLAEAVRWVDGGGGQVERVVVVRRSGQVVYANERAEDGAWKGRAGAAAEALEAERARPLSAEERAAAEGDIAMLRGLGDPKLNTEVDELERLVEELGVAAHEGADSAPKLFDPDDFVS